MARLTDAQQDVLLVKRFRLTPDELAAGQEFRNFCRNALGIDVHVGQVACAAIIMVRHVVSPETARFLTVMLASGNRAGKTSLLALIIIFSCLFKVNRPRPEPGDIAGADRWLKLEYHWYHFGIAQEVADLVFNDMVRILSGTHEGQTNGLPFLNGAPSAEWDLKEYGDYRWIRFNPQLGGAQVHFRTTGEKALGSLGKDMHGISFDEAGLERNLDFLIREVFNLRRLGTGGQLIMVSTPSEDLGTVFADNWMQGDPTNRDRLVSWRSMRMSSRDNVGYGLTQDMFDRLTADMDDRAIRQNIDGEFLQAKAAYFNGQNVETVFASGMPERIGPVRGGIYLQGCDPAKTQDSMWRIILKLVENPDDRDKPFLVGVDAQQRTGQKSTEAMVGMVYEGFAAYERGKLNSRCYTATDATGFGGKMFREALSLEVPNVVNVEFGGTIQKKRKLLGDLRTLIDEGRLILPRSGIWLKVRRQLLGYKLEDRGIEQDAVMALVCAVFLLRQTPVDGVDAGKFDLFGMDGDVDSPYSEAEQLSRARIRARLGV